MIVEVGILFNLFVTLVCVWAAMVINSKFLRPAVLNKKRFAIYELRDRLAMLAMRGVISEKSEEYLTLLRLMNGSLNSTKDFRITKFIRIQSEIITDKKIQAHLNSILKKIENEKMPKEYRVIVASFFECAREIYEHKTWMLRNLLTPLVLFVTALTRGIKFFAAARDFLAAQRQRINDIELRLEQNENRFAL